MAQSSTLAEIGIKLDARAIRERLASSKRDTDTLRRLLKIAERAEQRGSLSQSQETARVS